MLSTGDPAPAIELPDADMNMRTLAEFAGSWVVVYFYPKDDTPGCTIQANEFTDLSEAYAQAGITVLGISADDCFSHQAFRQKFGLKLILGVKIHNYPRAGEFRQCAHVHVCIRQFDGRCSFTCRQHMVYPCPESAFVERGMPAADAP